MGLDLSFTADVILNVCVCVCVIISNEEYNENMTDNSMFTVSTNNTQQNEMSNKKKIP